MGNPALLLCKQQREEDVEKVSERSPSQRGEGLSADVKG